MNTEPITGASATNFLIQLIAERPGYKELPLKVSRDFWDEPCTPQELEELDGEFRGEYHRLAQEIIKIWGLPVFMGDWESELCPDWADAIEIAYWHYEGYVAYVVYRQSDNEFPHEVVLGVQAHN